MTKVKHFTENQKDSEGNIPFLKAGNYSTCSEVCKKYDSCSAPLCPIFQWEGIWFGNEEVCTNPEFTQELVIQNQRKIARRSRDFDTYFTAAMLSHGFIIKAGLRGLDPDRETKYQNGDERAWINSHPEKKKLTPEEQKVIRDRLNKARGEYPDKKRA